MARSLRGLLLGSIAIAFLYLLVHAREPLRLNVGDPWADANVLTSIRYVESDGFLATSFASIHDVGPLTADSYRDLGAPPLSEIFYGAVGKLLGVHDIGTLRLFALMVSALALWLLFSYVRLLYSDRVAWIATTLFSTSLLWLMYADSIHQAPLLQCAAFLALWGLVRAIETRQLRHYAAAIAGAFACFFTSNDYGIFLPAAVLFTVYLKAGNPLGRGNRHLVALCAFGCLLGLLARWLAVSGFAGWHELVAATFHDRGSAPAMPTMIRRITLVFSPLVWITVAFHAMKAIRAPSLGAALKHTAIWILLAALAFLYVFPRLAASQMLAAQVVLPFYAIGSALLLDRLFERAAPPSGGAAGRGPAPPVVGRRALGWLAVAWLVAAPLWSFYFMFKHPRSVLDRGDVAKTNAFLAANDHNDFVLSNLRSDGHIAAAFQRHRWAALDANDPSRAPREMMRIFERTGTDYVHEIIFTGPDSRFLDQSLWPLTMPRAQWAIAGAPHMHRAKTNRMIAEYDAFVTTNLKAVKARKVLQLKNFAVYRVDRATTLALLTSEVPATSRIDFGSVDSVRHELLDWSGPNVLRDGTPASLVWAMEYCPAKPCKTIATARGLGVKDEAARQVGQVMIRVEPVCDLRLTFTFPSASYARLSINGFSTAPMVGTTMTFTVPVKHLTGGVDRTAPPAVDIVELENMFPPAAHTRLWVSALDLAPACAP